MLSNFGPVQLQQEHIYRPVEVAAIQSNYHSRTMAAISARRFIDSPLQRRPSKKASIVKQVAHHDLHVSHDLSHSAISDVPSDLPTPLPFLKELFISPHPDDICYSCFGTAVKGENASKNKKQNGRLIVTVFSKSRCANGHLGEQLKRNVDDITSVRKQEDEKFASSVNCNLVQLGMPDSSARDEYSRKEELHFKCKSEQAEATTSHPTYAKVVQKLNTVIRWAIKCRAAIYLPLGVGCHIDHMMTRVAAEAIMETVRREQQHDGLPNEVTYYEDLPYAFYQTEETMEILANTVLGPGHKTHLVVLDEKLWNRKMEAVQAYETQMKTTIIPSMDSRAVVLASKDEERKEADDTTPTEDVQRRERAWIMEPNTWKRGF